MMEQGSGVVVVIPTYQEREAIIPLLTSLRTVLPYAQLIVVDDGSPDGTAGIVRGFLATDRQTRLIVRDNKRGIGRAYMDGFSAALKLAPQVIVQMDADGSHDPREARRLIAAIRCGGADLAIGSRRIAGGSTPDWSRARNLLSIFGGRYARLLLRLATSDATSGYRAWRPIFIARSIAYPLRANGYAFQIETVWRAQQMGAKIIDLPITFRERRVGRSKMGIQIVLEAALLVLALMRDRYLGARR